MAILPSRIFYMPTAYTEIFKIFFKYICICVLIYTIIAYGHTTPFFKLTPMTSIRQLLVYIQHVQRVGNIFCWHILQISKKSKLWLILLFPDPHYRSSLGLSIISCHHWVLPITFTYTKLNGYTRQFICHRRNNICGEKPIIKSHLLKLGKKRQTKE